MKHLGRRIENLTELMDNLHQVDVYLDSGYEEDYNEIGKLIRRGTDFVVYKCGAETRFAPSRFIGYLNNTLLVHLVKKNGKDGSQTTDRINKILGYRCKYDERIEKEYLSFCDGIGVIPKKMTNACRKYWILDKRHNIKYADEYSEGNIQQILVNKYERNPIARKQCLVHYGDDAYTCQICGFNFIQQYGEIGKDFIHIHHIVPLSERGRKYTINPENDLIPVCPNCHAMLHRKDKNGKVLSVKDLRALLKR